MEYLRRYAKIITEHLWSLTISKDSSKTVFKNSLHPIPREESVMTSLDKKNAQHGFVQCRSSVINLFCYIQFTDDALDYAYIRLKSRTLNFINDLVIT